MTSTFGGLSIASSALAAQRAALTAAGHNIANANTPGFSRQQVHLAPRSSGLGGLHSGTGLGSGGVRVTAQQRVVDQFLIARSNVEQGHLGNQVALQDLLSRVERSFGEPGENGLASQMAAFWAAWDDVAANPGDLAARSAVLQRASAVADSFNRLSSSLQGISDNLLKHADVLTTELNVNAQAVAELNVAVQAARASGANPSDLEDQRDAAIRRMAEIAGVTTRLREDGQIDVLLGGVALVSGSLVETVELDASVPDHAVLRTTSGGFAVRMTSGSITGLLEGANVVVPKYRDHLDAVAADFAEMVNDHHTGGYDLNGAPGVPVFQSTDGGAITAGTITLNELVAGHPERLAASADPDAPLDGSHAASMAALATRPDGPDASYRAMLAELGVQVQGANRRLELQLDLAQDVDAQREAVSGVSLDEEMASLVQYQHAFEAASKFLSVVDSMLDTIINGIGR